MAVAKKNTAAVIVLFVVAVLFFITILCFALFLDDSATQSKIIDDDVEYTRMDVSVDFDADRTCFVKNSFSARFKTYKHGIIVDIPVNSGEKVRGLKVDCALPYEVGYEAGRKLVYVKIGDPDRIQPSGYVLDCTIAYDYITPEHKSGSDILAFMPIGGGWASPIQDARVTVTYPVAPDFSADDLDYGIYIGGRKIEDGAQGVSWSADNKTVTVDAGRLAAYNGVEIAYKMPDGTLENHYDLGWIGIVIAASVLFAAAVVVMIVFGRDKPLTPVLEFYPPRVTGKSGRSRYMLPVQMGKIIDGTCSAEDVTSLIFYWASKGFLAIDDREDGTYLRRLSEVDEVTQYERRFFEALFAKAKCNEKGERELKITSDGKLASAVSAVSSAVNAEYRGKFYKSKFTAISAAMSVLCGLLGVLSAVLVTLSVSARLFNFGGFLVVLPVFISALLGALINRYWFKLPQHKRRLYIALYSAVTVLLSVAVMFIIPTDAMSWWGKIPFALLLGGAAAIAPFITVRSEYYTEQLNSVMGFRDFIRDAEKERLEQLLEENPQYYYDILPYANVLGVSDIWADKFKDITVPPPAYYTSTHSVLFDIFMFRSITRSIGRSISAVPKSNSGSFSSGGGFGGGGGFSGGSFGGGGGRSW